MYLLLVEDVGLQQFADPLRVLEQRPLHTLNLLALLLEILVLLLKLPDLILEIAILFLEHLVLLLVGGDQALGSPQRIFPDLALRFEVEQVLLLAKLFLLRLLPLKLLEAGFDGWRRGQLLAHYFNYFIYKNRVHSEREALAVRVELFISFFLMSLPCELPNYVRDGFGECVEATEAVTWLQFTIGCLLMGLISGLSSLAGLGGGGPNIVVMILCFNIMPKHATIAVFASILGSSFGNMVNQMQTAFNN